MIKLAKFQFRECKVFYSNVKHKVFNWYPFLLLGSNKCVGIGILQREPVFTVLYQNEYFLLYVSHLLSHFQRCLGLDNRIGLIKKNLIGGNNLYKPCSNDNKKSLKRIDTHNMYLFFGKTRLDEYTKKWINKLRNARTKSK